MRFGAGRRRARHERASGLYGMPYGDDEIGRPPRSSTSRWTTESAAGLFWVVGRGCLDGEAWRVEVGLYSDATPEDIAAVREMMAPYGDTCGCTSTASFSCRTRATARWPRDCAFISLRSPQRCVRAATIRSRRAGRRVR